MFSTWIMVHLTANLSGSWVGQDMRNSMGRLLDSFDLSVPSTSRSSIAYILANTNRIEMMMVPERPS